MTTPLNQDVLSAQLANAVNMRSAHDQVLWTVFSLFATANAILLVALFQRETFSFHAGAAIALVGTAFSSVWWLVNTRLRGHIKKREELIKQIEEELNIREDLRISSSIRATEPTKVFGHPVMARIVIIWSSAVATMSWLIASGIFLAMLAVK